MHCLVNSSRNVLSSKMRLTKRALDGWDSPAFSSIFLVRTESCSRSFVHAHPPASNANRWVAIAMNKYTSKVLALIIISTILTSCGKVENVQTPPSLIKQNTPITSVSPTSSPTAESLPTITPYPTTLADATAQAFNFVLCNNNPISWWDISPNGKWLAATCTDENGTGESPLFVSSIDRSRNWKIHYSDYIFSPSIEKIGLSLDKHDGVIPKYWSKDGRFLFAIVGSRLDGCCWISGSRYSLLVRLNLETGEQVALLNVDYYSANVFNFIISASDRYLLFTPPSANQLYDFAVLDFQTWKTQEVFLKVKRDVHMDYAKLSPKEDKVILPLFIFNDLPVGHYFIDSIALIDLSSREQDILIANIKPEEQLYPIQWLDDKHVLISNINPIYDSSDKIERQWILDIISRQLEEKTP